MENTMFIVYTITSFVYVHCFDTTSLSNA